MSKARSIAAAVAAGFLLSSAPAPARAAGQAGAFAAAPSANAPKDRRGTYFRLHARRGASRRQSVVVENLSPNRKHLLIDPVDGLTGTTSGAVYANRDDVRRKAGTWIALADRNIVVAPHSQVRIPFTLTVPETARSGDHLAGIAVQDAHRTHAGAELAVTQIIRLVVGVQITVDGLRQAEIGLGSVAMKPLPGTKVPSVVVHLANTGTQLCKPNLDVGVTGEDGQQQTVSRKLDTVLPGTAIDYPLPWPRALAAGDYQVAVQAKDCGQPTATQASTHLGSNLLGTPDHPESITPIVVREAAIPWAAIAGMMGAFGATSAGGMAMFMRRRRRDPE